MSVLPHQICTIQISPYWCTHENMSSGCKKLKWCQNFCYCVYSVWFLAFVVKSYLCVFVVMVGCENWLKGKRDQWSCGASCERQWGREFSATLLWGGASQRLGFPISGPIISKYPFSAYCHDRFPFPNWYQPCLILILLFVDENH